MSNADLRGKFVWHELATNDTAGASTFYPKVISWKTQPWEQDASYTLLVGANGPIGGVMSAGADGAAQWIAYIGAPDIAATVAAAKQLGASVLKDVSEVPGAGKYAVLKDPQGATFAVYTPAPGTPSSSGAPAVGDFSWHELATSDYEAAMRFYSQVFGWEKGRTHDMGGGMTYQLFNHGGEEVGGIFNGDSTGAPTAWTCYVRVEDAAKAANAAKAAGGRVLNGPMEVPGGDWVAQVMDPQGVSFAVHEKKAAARAAKPAAKPAVKPAAKPATKPANSLPDKPAAAKPAAAPAPAAAKPAAKPASKPAAKQAPKRAAKKAAKTTAKKAATRPAGKAARKSKPARKAAKRPAARQAKKSAARAKKKTGAKKSAKTASRKGRKRR